MAGLETGSFEQSLNNEKLINEIVKNPKNLGKERKDRSEIEELLDQSKSYKDTYSIFLGNTRYIFKNGEISKDKITNGDTEQEKSIVEETRKGLKGLLNNILETKNKENTPSEEDEINGAKALNDSIQKKAENPEGYTPPSDNITTDKDGDKTKEKNNLKPKGSKEKSTSDYVLAKN